MNEFVEECRSEWRRLGVSDPVANEMAADLAADLEEAEAEGASAEEVLGSGAFDPRSFAAAWAAERGLIQLPLPSGHGLPRRFHLPAAIGAFALIAIIGAVLVILASPPAPGRLALVSVGPPPGAVPQTVRVVTAPLPASGARIVVVAEPALAPDGTQIAFVRDGRLLVRPLAEGTNDSGVDLRIVGSVLLAVGLAGVVPLTMFWLWVGPGRWSRRRTHIDVRPSGPAS